MEVSARFGGFANFAGRTACAAFTTLTARGARAAVAAFAALAIFARCFGGVFVLEVFIEKTFLQTSIRAMNQASEPKSCETESKRKSRLRVRS